eukprot:gene3115-biopygen11855
MTSASPGGLGDTKSPDILFNREGMSSFKSISSPTVATTIKIPTGMANMNKQRDTCTNTLNKNAHSVTDNSNLKQISHAF